jgi:Na+/melibiose symporter-like transporter
MPFEFMIPIVMFIVTGAVIITFLFFRSREREMILAKDYTAEELILLLNPGSKKKGVLVVLGILTASFGLGMLTGTIIDKATGENDYIPFIMFIFVGIGLITSFYVREKLNKKEGE